MSDTFIEGPDATRLLTAVSANNYENFAVGQAKQFVPVAADGNIITDGILLRTASPDLAGYRKYLGLYSFEGKNPLYGSFFSEDIKAAGSVRRTKVTLVFDPADAALAIAPGRGLALSNGRYRVESGGALADQAYHTASLAPANAVLSWPSSTGSTRRQAPR